MQHKNKTFFKKNLRSHNRINSGNKIEVNFGIDRVVVFKGVLIFVFSLISVRLFYIQVIKYDDYKAQASVYQDVIDKIPAKRGEIYIASDKDVDLKAMKTYNSSNVDKLDRLAVNVYKYNIIFQ